MASPLPSRDYNTVPPLNNPDITRLMEERGVGRKRAYAILKQEKAASFNVEVPMTHRAQILTYLVDHGGQCKNAMLLLQGLHEAGVGIDMHDTIKTLWALQKNRYVQFRERNNPPSLFAIKVTDEGLAAYSSMKERLAQDARDLASFRDTAQAFIAGATAPVLDPFVEERIPETIIEPEPTTAQMVLPWEPGIMAGFPHFRDIRDRARKSAELAQAAQLLEEAGEDDIALELISRSSFSDLEDEVIALLNHIGEL